MRLDELRQAVLNELLADKTIYYSNNAGLGALKGRGGVKLYFELFENVKKLEKLKYNTESDDFNSVNPNEWAQFYELTETDGYAFQIRLPEQDEPEFTDELVRVVGDLKKLRQRANRVKGYADDLAADLAPILRVHDVRVWMKYSKKTVWDILDDESRDQITYNLTADDVREWVTISPGELITWDARENAKLFKHLLGLNPNSTTDQLIERIKDVIL